MGERGTEGLSEIESELERERQRAAEVVEGAVFGKQNDHGENVFFFLCFFGSSLQTDVWVKLILHYVSHDSPKQNKPSLRTKSFSTVSVSVAFMVFIVKTNLQKVFKPQH